ncbi:plasmid partitioning protein RepB C-terminal domain-containing protein [Caulobacter sp. UNC279MFTsu5.1]|uniref:plasmid partitioning protein RepB C-terminal domain-containing protein n=1 Tax=Caulobacter sp. UNC279MFTsu5.1 TaxID=1502775 RepID=UPI0008F0F58D|nr:plasmid partitioning protein RepB C-terminal domain-containing protein [Caulobacter sp. UNC279MFTsu5.1]SFI52965.1 ParB-like nuclease domain-containing protein [Caulobacter sp. UNC279MFTsu5.1]
MLTVRAAFEQDLITVRLDEILPMRKLPDKVLASVKFRRIAQSVAEVGVIEPLVVVRSPGAGPYMLLDGHVRLAILKDLGERQTRCLISDDDEAFTYNKRVNRLATIQEHYMIVRALERGVSEDKLARALNVDVKGIRRRRSLLEGVTPEVVDLLKDRAMNPVTFDVLRKLKPMRQIEVAELMVSAGNFTSAYAKALLAATRQADLVQAHKPKKVGGMTAEQMARMEREMESLTQDFKALESSYGDDVLHLVIASGYLSRLVGNPEIERYLRGRHPEILDEFRAIVAATSLDRAVTLGGASENPLDPPPDRPLAS